LKAGYDAARAAKRTDDLDRLTTAAVFRRAADQPGRARWVTGGREGRSFALTRSVRDVLLGDDPQVAMTERARTVLGKLPSTERRLAVATLAARLTDLDSARAVLGEPMRFAHLG
jgi:hypothetical protein